MQHEPMARSSTKRWSALLAIVVVAAVVVVAALSTDPGDPAFDFPITADPEVPFVPTPEDVLDEMLEMAAVGRDDVIYDLGCGDGRIVIAAAKRFGARGVGIDIDPRRIRESNEAARREGVTDRVRFIRGDLFDADLKDATVVTLYLLPLTNLSLKPKLLRELAPGTRVVSHNYGMGDWTPAREKQIGNHRIFLWIVP